MTNQDESLKNINFKISKSKNILNLLRNSILVISQEDLGINAINLIDNILNSELTNNSYALEWNTYLYNTLTESKLINDALNNQLTRPEVSHLGSYLKSIHSACIYFEYFSLEIIKKIKEGELKDTKVKDFKNVNHELYELKKELALYKNSAQNKKAEIIYDSAYNRYEKKEKNHRNWFIGSLILSVLITLGYDPNFTILANLSNLLGSLTSTSALHNQSALSNYSNELGTVLQDYSFLKFIFFKIATLLVGVTLSTYFLKLSNYYRSLKDQAHQTKLELEAFPDYVAGLDHEVTNRLREELALKYFGQELDKSVNEKFGNLVQDQISAGTELVKASAELIKKQ